MKTLHVKNLELSESHNIVVSLGKAGVVLGASKISEGVDEVDSIREEDIIIDEYLLFFSLVRVQGHQIAIHDSLCTLYSSL